MNRIWLLLGLVAGSVVTLVIALLVRNLLGLESPEPAQATSHFVEEAAGAGIGHVYDGDFTFFVGGGVAVFDCNDDHRPELYFAGGTNPATLFVNHSQPGGELRFAPLAATSTDLAEVTGAYPLDIDSDGEVDLAVLRLGENVMLRGLGECRFERANEAWGLDGGDSWTAAFSARWEGSGPLPTLAFGNYVALDETGHQTGECSDNFLFRPAGEDGYHSPIPLSPGWCTLSILFSDWDRSGGGDLRLTNDRHYYRDGEEQLWRIVEGESPHLYGRDEGWQRMQIWGMGIASHDLTGDGLPEVFLTSQGDNKLQTLAGANGQPTYTDVAFRRGATAHRPFLGDTTLPSTGWHAEFQDINNDGYIDLFIAKGNVEAMPDYASQDPSNLLLGQADGTFVESAPQAGVVSFARGRGAALVDLNLDGMLDLVKVNRRENVEVWRSVGWGSPDRPAPMGNWLAVRLLQEGTNRDGVGSWIEVKGHGRSQVRELTVGGGHAGGQLGWIHFGLGEADRARVRVQWPDGANGPWQTVDTNQFVFIERDAEPRVWNPRA